MAEQRISLAARELRAALEAEHQEAFGRVDPDAVIDALCEEVVTGERMLVAADLALSEAGAPNSAGGRALTRVERIAALARRAGA